MNGNPTLSHIDAAGLPGLVDVSAKPGTPRTARSQARIWLPESVLEALSGGEIASPKGPVVQTAIVAGTLAAKKTWELIPLCHPIPLDRVSFTRRWEGSELVLECETGCRAPTGVEMESLVGASVAALTVYDMCKALSHRIEIRSVRLISKTGGKSDLEAP